MSLREQIQEFLELYCSEEITELAQRYPQDQQHLRIDCMELIQFDEDIANDLLNHFDEFKMEFVEELKHYPLPVDVEVENVEIRLINLPESRIYSPIEILEANPDGYIGIRGQLSKVTTPSNLLETCAFKCLRCTTTVEMPQPGGDLQEPSECAGCDRRGPFEINQSESEFVDFCKVRIESPPDERGDLQNEHIDGKLTGNLVWSGGDDGILGRSGDGVVLYGSLDFEEKGTDELLFEEYVDARAIEFAQEQEELDIASHKERFRELAQREDAVDIFAESLVPELHETPEWETALELLVAYLFAAPRVDVPQGPTYRGDIHTLIISDYGMGKSMVNESIALYSPDCIKESVTGMSSEVGLLAAAVEDDFGEGQWTLKPGILVRGNGGHVILDEIDKTSADLEKMNDALEGKQQIDVNKAGQDATYQSQVGLLATGNPEGSRFNEMEPISSQLDLDQSLLSRFDGIVTMSDEADREQDRKVAETQGESYIEAQELEHGQRDELDCLDRVVSPELGKNWIAYARENIDPILQPRHVEMISGWYAEDVRELNKKFDSGENEEMPVPVSARAPMAAIRFSVAFARLHLREEVKDEDVERAIELSKSLVGQQFDGGKFIPEESRTADTQERRISQILQSVSDKPTSMDNIKTAVNAPDSKIETDVEKLKRQGRIYEPNTGEYLKS